MSFRDTLQQTLDAQVKRVLADHPKFVIREIGYELTATIGEIRASLKRLGVTMRDGRPPRRNSEN
jgi:hypothetical protein